MDTPGQTSVTDKDELVLPDGDLARQALDLNSVAQLYEVRRGLERIALRRRCHDRSQLEAIHDDWSRLRPPARDTDCGPDFVLLDEHFHLSIAHASGNHALVEVLRGVNEQIRWARANDFLTRAQVTRTITEHLGIVEALLDADVNTAEDRLSAHLYVSERIVEQLPAPSVPE